MEPDSGKKLIVLQASSSCFKSINQAKITINDKKIDVDPNENGHTRGLHLAVINPNNGKVVYTSVFDTYQGSY